MGEATSGVISLPAQNLFVARQEAKLMHLPVHLLRKLMEANLAKVRKAMCGLTLPKPRRTSSTSSG
jgi:hypothetical protein